MVAFSMIQTFWRVLGAMVMVRVPVKVPVILMYRYEASDVEPSEIVIVSSPSEFTWATYPRALSKYSSEELVVAPHVPDSSPTVILVRRRFVVYVAMV